MKKFVLPTIAFLTFTIVFSVVPIHFTNTLGRPTIKNHTQAKNPTNIIISTYISPTILYKNQANQPIILVVKNKNGSYINNASFAVQYENNTSAKFTVKEICSGFYRFIIDTTNLNGSYITFTATLSKNSESIHSNTLKILLTDKKAFNPYIDINTIYAIKPFGKDGLGCGCGITRTVFDKLPLSVGNAFEIKVSYWGVSDPSNWYIYKVQTSVNGPIYKIDKNRYVCNGAGKITAFIKMIAWKRIDTTCPSWEDQVNKEEMGTNAKPFIYSRTFTIGEIRNIPILGMVSFSGGEQIDFSNIEAGKTGNLDIELNLGDIGPNIEVDNPQCIVIHVFMTDGNKILPDAFTINNEDRVSEIWYNPANADKTGIPEIPIPFSPTTPSIKVLNDCSRITFNNIRFNYPNSPDSGYHLILQIFSKEIKHDIDKNTYITFPLVSETMDVIQIDTTVKVLNSTATIKEGTATSNKILAGVNPIIEISDPHFTFGKPKWVFSFNGTPIEGKAEKTSNGYTIKLKHSVGDEGNVEVCGYAYSSASQYSKGEVVDIKIPVVKPYFTVQIELSDGSVIDDDSIITEGIIEKIYVTPTDPRYIHDFSTGQWSLKPEPDYITYGIPESEVYYHNYGKNCIGIIPYDNPFIHGDSSIKLNFVANDGTEIFINNFKIVPPVVATNPKEIPFITPTIPSHITLGAIDAHGHGIPNLKLAISSNKNSSSGIIAGVTNPNGELDFTFTPQKFGTYNIFIYSIGSIRVRPPCRWRKEKAIATIKEYKPRTAITLQPNNPIMTINGVSKEIDPGRGTTPVIIPEWGRTVVPIRAIVEALGGTIQWDGKERKVTINFKETTIELWIGKPQARVNDEMKWIDSNNHNVKPVIINDRTMLPLRFVAENLGCTVYWNSVTRTIIITHK